MSTPANNRSGAGAACVRCGKVDAPIRVGRGPGWLAIVLWAASAALWTLGMITGASWLTWPTAAVFLAALIYTLWYFYKREEACRHCGAHWTGPGHAAPM